MQNSACSEPAEKSGLAGTVQAGKTKRADLEFGMDEREQFLAHPPVFQQKYGHVLPMQQNRGGSPHPLHNRELAEELGSLKGNAAQHILGDENLFAR